MYRMLVEAKPMLLIVLIYSLTEPELKSQLELPLEMELELELE